MALVIEVVVKKLLFIVSGIDILNSESEYLIYNFCVNVFLILVSRHWVEFPNMFSHYPHTVWIYLYFEMSINNEFDQ
jgi:hypothetical protein